MQAILIIGVVLLLSSLSSKVLYKYGIPTLIDFLALGIISGPEVLGLVNFNNLSLARQISDFALIFIMFSGGFGTSWKAAKQIAFMSGVLATIGVVVTALIVGLATHLFLGFGLMESLLLGSIVSSTDAAAVFSILRSKKLNLKGNLASTLEVESGSNDPMANMLTVVVLGAIMAKPQNMFVLFGTQLLIGAACGLAFGKLAVWVINRIKLDVDGLYFIVCMGLVLVSFALTGLLGGNGFLSVYIAGIIMGNSRITHRISLIRFFDGITWLMQIMLFFTLGLLSSPSGMRTIWPQGLAVALIIMFVARPIAIFALTSLFKMPIKEKLLVSWVGFRGAAAVVFAIYPLAAGIPGAETIFNIVFFVILLSVLVQGSLLIPIAKKLKLAGPEPTALKTFSDYAGEFHTDLLELDITELSGINGKAIMDIPLPDDVLIVTVKRGDTLITPRGSTVLMTGDTLLLAADSKDRLVEIDKMAKAHGRIHKL
ncbi:MAG TPA: potassium/proton antiporter [Bacillota bacterium]|nr:potassium/proton antiporter [Bacillota bacterium]HPM63298.1 potassium/proton antiporter [Bacillota bacterium]